MDVELVNEGFTFFSCIVEQFKICRVSAIGRTQVASTISIPFFDRPAGSLSSIIIRFLLLAFPALATEAAPAE
ncbi:MAG: hypothetical protein WCK32_09945 [Chlorobiaceae bacterium]